MRTAFLALLLALPAAGWAVEAEAVRSPTIIAVGIAHKVPELKILTQGSFSLIDQKTGEIKRLRQGEESTVRTETGGVRVGSLRFRDSARLLPGRPEEFVLIGGRKYRGNLVFQPNADGSVTAIDELDIEDYLLGVLPDEMAPDWPVEALKAQAVVARTFALNNLGKYSTAGFDLSDDSRSQIYTGQTVQSERIEAAVRGTRGQVLTWDGKRLQAYFHSCCGGRTLDPAEVWGAAAPAPVRSSRSPPPLRGVRDRFCRGTPYCEWTAYFRGEDILKTLQRHGWAVVSLDGLRLGRRHPAGFLRDIHVSVDRQWLSLPAEEFRRWMGAWELKSTRINRISRGKKGFEFQGTGYGHGVGLCQWGARRQAEDGRDYREILDHYFPGAALTKLEAP